MTTRRHFMNVSSQLSLAVVLAGFAGGAFGHHYRPAGDKAKAKYASQFPRLTLFTID